jgi:hypothetical protein
MIGVVSSVWVLSLVALRFLWRRRPRTVLDLWLMVVMCAWVFDVALGACSTPAVSISVSMSGRTYGLLASGFVLLVLLFENAKLYARLAEAHEKRVKRLGILREHRSRAIAAEESPDAIAAAVIEPLRDCSGAARGRQRFRPAAGKWSGSPPPGAASPYRAGCATRCS